MTYDEHDTIVWWIGAALDGVYELIYMLGKKYTGKRLINKFEWF